MRLVGILFVTLLVIACNKKKQSLEKDLVVIAELEMKNQSLQKSLQEIDTMLDSINYTLCVEKETHSKELSSAEKLSKINTYVKQTALRLKDQERQIRNIKIEADAYLMMMDALKSEAEIREGYVQHLTDSLHQFKMLATNDMPLL